MIGKISIKKYFNSVTDKASDIAPTLFALLSLRSNVYLVIHVLGINKGQIT
jgi:hypothetical protein